MRILVNDVLHRKHCASFLQVLGDHLVGRLGGQAGKLARLFGEFSMAVHWDNNGQLRVMVAADFKVFYAMSRRSMDTAGTAFQSDMIS